MIASLYTFLERGQESFVLERGLLKGAAGINVLAGLSCLSVMKRLEYNVSKIFGIHIRVFTVNKYLNVDYLGLLWGKIDFGADFVL